MIVAVFIFSSYKGYISFLKTSDPVNPYYSVANIHINTTNSFEKEYNASFGFDLCFSDSYGTALYGNFLLNLTKDTGMISSLLNSSSNSASFSSLILTGSLSSLFEKPPVSSSTISTLPVGSYFINSSGIASLLVLHNLPTILA